MAEEPNSKKRQVSRGRTPSGRPNPIDAHVGSRIRLRRTLLGLSQEKLGQAMGLTFQQVQKYEHGVNRLGASRLYDMALVLEVPVTYFFEEMPEEVESASPRNILGKTEEPPEVPDNMLNKRETLELVRAYTRIADLNLRKHVMTLALALGGDEDVDFEEPELA